MKEFLSLPWHAFGGSAARHLTVIAVVTCTLFLTLLSSDTKAAELRLAWDPVDRTDLGGYEVHYGLAAGSYDQMADLGDISEATISDLVAGQAYFFAVRAYTTDKRIFSPFSSELRATAIATPAPAPTASFTASPTSGTAPLVVLLSDTSVGPIASREWDLGDGSTSTGASVVKTYTVPGLYTVKLTVSGLEGTSFSTATRTLSVQPGAPVAAFDATPTSGTTPLAVRFATVSTGAIDSYRWDFGDGVTSDSANPTHTYFTAGQYDVRLTVAGPGGDDTLVKTGLVSVQWPDAALPIARGAVSASRHFWRRVEFDRPFKDPIVVLGPRSSTDPKPALMRIRRITSEGFEVRAQRWDSYERPTGTYDVDYLVIERGTHQLPDGAWIEAGRYDQSLDGRTLVRRAFTAPFVETPVVATTIGSYNGRDGVTTRIDHLSESAFKLTLQEQEINPPFHYSEAIHYVAWEPSSGVVGGLRYEVAHAPERVDHHPGTVEFQMPFTATPSVFAQMQSYRGRDTATLRRRSTDRWAFEVWVEEEDSRDAELRHLPEAVGYIALDE